MLLFRITRFSALSRKSLNDEARLSLFQKRCFVFPTVETADSVPVRSTVELGQPPAMNTLTCYSTVISKWCRRTETTGYCELVVSIRQPLLFSTKNVLKVAVRIDDARFSMVRAEVQSMLSMAWVVCKALAIE